MTRTKRKVMRKTLAVLMAMVLLAGTLMSLAGCGCGSEAVTTDAELTEENTTATAEDGTETTETETDTEETATDTEETSAEEENTEEAAAEEPEGTTTAAEETTTEATDAETTTKEAATTTKEAATTTKTTSEEPTAATSGYTYTSMSKTMYVKSQVNVRSLPSTDGTKLGSLSAGTAVTVTGQCNETGWYRIEYNGSVGYVSNNYLTSTKPSTTTTTTTKASSGGSTTTYSSMIEKASALGILTNNGGTWNPFQFDECYEQGLFTNSDLEKLCREYAEQVVELTNKKRSNAGVQTLEMNEVLMEAAQTRACEQVQSFGHTRPDGSLFESIIDGLLSYNACGENADQGAVNPSAAINNWMNSSGHKANMLNESYNAMGAGVYYDKDAGVFYWVQIFVHTTTHTHIWATESCILATGDGAGGTIIIEEAYLCTVDGCNAYKDADGVVHE